MTRAPANLDATLASLQLRRWSLRETPAAACANAVPDEATAAAGEPPPRDTILKPADDWSALEARVAACTRCELHGGRNQTVFGVGPHDAPILVIGEGPGAEEDRMGEPFVGRAGRLLDAMLAAIGHDRVRSVYIANMVKCRPPQNRDPRPDETAACRGYLERQIDLLNPRVIVALGRVAAQNLLGSDDTLGKMRGRDWHYGDRKIPVIVTYHPAYLLRSPGQKAKAWQDLKRLRQMVGSP